MPIIRSAISGHRSRCFPAAGVLVQNPACVRLERNKRIAASVIGEADASVVLAYVAVVAGLLPLGDRAEQSLAEHNACFL